MKKYSFILLLLVWATSTYAQQKMPFQINLEGGLPLTPLNSKMYGSQALNKGKEAGLGLKFPLSKNLALGLEGHYREFDVSSLVSSHYQGITQVDPAALFRFKPSQILNGIGSINWYKYSKNGKNLFEVGVGGGLQALAMSQSSLTFSNPLRLGQTDTLYSHSGKSNAVMGQLSLQNTFFITKNIGIRLALKAQYAPNMYRVGYVSTGGKTMTFEEFCNTTQITQTTANPISFVPTAGITIQLGGKKPKPVVATVPVTARPPKEEKKEEEQKQGECFDVKLLTKIENGCFGGEKFRCQINQRFRERNAPRPLRYEVSIAPFNKLTEQELITTIATAGIFEIAASKFRTSTVEYIIILKSVYQDSKYNCLQFIKPIRRCPDACLDVTLPEIPIKK